MPTTTTTTTTTTSTRRVSVWCVGAGSRNGALWSRRSSPPWPLPSVKESGQWTDAFVDCPRVLVAAPASRGRPAGRPPRGETGDGRRTSRETDGNTRRHRIFDVAAQEQTGPAAGYLSFHWNRQTARRRFPLSVRGRSEFGRRVTCMHAGVDVVDGGPLGLRSHPRTRHWSILMPRPTTTRHVAGFRNIPVVSSAREEWPADSRVHSELSACIVCVCNATSAKYTVRLTKNLSLKLLFINLLWGKNTVELKL